MEDDITIIHSYFEECEPDQYFKDMEIIYKENRILERMYEGEIITQGYVDYIAKKCKVCTSRTAK